MKYIPKGVEPNSLVEWRSNNQGVNWDEFCRTDAYSELKEHLLDEQGGLCCYCEIAIDGDRGTHIEHHRPKSRFQANTFDYQNLLASCQSTDSCGHKKGGGYFPELISPLSDDCQDRFIYTGDGRIIPKDKNDAHAQDTIELLGLNCKRLKDRRESILKALEQSDNDYISEALANFRDWFYGFYTVVKYLAQKRNIQHL